MKCFLALFLFPLAASAAFIPLEPFASAKLETLLRGMPSTFTNSEKIDDFVRKNYVFPKDREASFTIKCSADYYGSAPIPSAKNCEVDVKDEKASTDEVLFVITDSEVVSEMRKAIPYGDVLKKFYSHERVYGKGHDGISRNLFRFAFNCKEDQCDITFARK